MSAETYLYNLKQPAPDHFIMSKFDHDFNVAATYNITPRGNGWTCDCPAGARAVKLKPCKHQRMIKFMLGAVNTGRFFSPETGMWCQPILADQPETAQPQPSPDSLRAEPQEQLPQAAPRPQPTPNPSAGGVPIIRRRVV